MTISVPVQRGMTALNLRTIAPKRGEIYQLQGSGRVGSSMRKYAEIWAASALLRGECVHWVDGASRIDPARILAAFPPTESAPQEHLRRLFIGRGFTVHQLTTLVERLAREVSITASPLVIIDGPIGMHLDRQVGDHEARCLMRRMVVNLQHLAKTHHVAVIIITSNQPKSKRHQHLLSMVERRANQQLQQAQQATLRNRGILIHQPTGAIGVWPSQRPFITLVQSIGYKKSTSP